MSIPFFGKQFTFTQPDGTRIELRGWGHHHQAVFETLSGERVARNPRSGFFEPLSERGRQPDARVNRSRSRSSASDADATRSPAASDGWPAGIPRWKQRRKQTKQRVLTRGPASQLAMQRRRTGVYAGLCLPIEFDDYPAAISRDEIDAFCNDRGYGGFGNNGSVCDYFFDNSCGKLRYTNIVAPYYKARRPRTYYTDERVENAVRAQELICEALRHHIANGFPFDALSRDPQGYVYAVNVLYAGPCTNVWPKGLWPHCHSLPEPLELAPGVHASDYQITNTGEELALGTFCHENGHMLCDFPDLYDDDAVPESQGVGRYCLMCTGGTSDEKNPGNVCAYLKYQAGWCEVTEIAGTLDAVAKSGRNEVFVHHRNENEYFVLENRHQSSRDSDLPASGLAIWHVDELSDNCQQDMTPGCHYECSLEQADGACHLEKNVNDGDENDLFHAGGRNRFGDDTDPSSRWWDGTSSHLEVYDIGPAGPEITFSAAISRSR